MVKKNQTYSTLGLCQKTAERKSTKSEQSPSSQRPKQEDNSFFLFIKHSAAEIRVKDSSGFMSRDKRFCVKDLLQAISVTTRFVLQLRTLSIVRNDAILLLRCIVGN